MSDKILNPYQGFYWFDFTAEGWFPQLFFNLNSFAMYALPEIIDEFAKYDEPRIHMDRLMKAKLVEFDLSLRILIPLEDAGIKTLGDLTKRTRKDLLNISQLGKTKVEKIESFLAYHKLTLAK